MSCGTSQCSGLTLHAPRPRMQGNADRALWVMLSVGTKPINTLPRFHPAVWAGGRQLLGFPLLPNHFAYGTFGALCSEEERRRPIFKLQIWFYF